MINNTDTDKQQTQMLITDPVNLELIKTFKNKNETLTRTSMNISGIMETLDRQIEDLEYDRIPETLEAIQARAVDIKNEAVSLQRVLASWFIEQEETVTTETDTPQTLIGFAQKSFSRGYFLIEATHWGTLDRWLSADINPEDRYATDSTEVSNVGRNNCENPHMIDVFKIKQFLEVDEVKLLDKQLADVKKLVKEIEDDMLGDPDDVDFWWGAERVAQYHAINTDSKTVGELHPL